MKLQSRAKRRDSQGGQTDAARWAGHRQGGVREEGFQCSEETRGAGTERKELSEWRAQPSSAWTWLSEKRTAEEVFSACFKGWRTWVEQGHVHKASALRVRMSTFHGRHQATPLWSSFNRHLCPLCLPGGQSQPVPRCHPSRGRHNSECVPITQNPGHCPDPLC